jgi:hypothetical protein
VPRVRMGAPLVVDCGTGANPTGRAHRPVRGTPSAAFDRRFPDLEPQSRPRRSDGITIVHLDSVPHQVVQSFNPPGRVGHFERHDVRQRSGQMDADLRIDVRAGGGSLPLGRDFGVIPPRSSFG